MHQRRTRIGLVGERPLQHRSNGEAATRLLEGAILGPGMADVVRDAPSTPTRDLRGLGARGHIALG